MTARAGGHPVFNRISRHIEKAATQFDAVNSARLIPNILILVNHDRASHFGDLRETVTGMFHAEGGEREPTMLHISEGRIGQSKQRIDLFVWVDFSRKRVQGYLFNQAGTPDHVGRVCELLGLDRSKIKP